VFQIEDNVHQLIWSIHHVVIDGWCLSVLLHEMLEVYEAIRQSREPVLNPSRPFRDYVAWITRQIDERAEGYWRQALRGVTAATPLELDGGSMVAGARRAKTVAERETLLPADLTTALQAMVRSHRLTLSTLVQGAWALLLSRYSGRSDVLFGVTVSGRPTELSGVESMVGMFINVLPLRAAVIEELKLVAWLHELQATMVELRRLEGVPLSRIQAWSEVPPGMPMFESVLIVQNLPFLASLQERASRLGIESARYRERTHYPLAVTVVPGTELGIRIAFDTQRFSPSVIDRTLGHFRTILEAMVVDPERRIVDLPWMTEGEQKQILDRWNLPRSELRLHELDVDQLTEEELDNLIAQLDSGMREQR
jgi:hypothetical protein